MVESERVEPEERPKKKSSKPRRVGHIKMKVLSDLKADTIDREVKHNIERDSRLDTDDSTSYVHLGDLVSEHRPQVIPKNEIVSMLPWVHIAISNA